MTWRGVLVCVGLLLLFTLPVGARTNDLYAQQLEASGAQELKERLPADTQALLDSLSLGDWQPESMTDLSFSSVLDVLLQLLRDNASGPSAVLATLVALVALSALFGGLEGLTERASLRETYHSVSVLAGAGLLIGSFQPLLDTVWRAVDSVRVFMLSFVPVYAAVVAAGGSPSGALSYQTTLLAAAQLLTAGIHAVVLPVLLVSVAFGCIGTVADGFCLTAFSQSFYRAVLWGLGLFSTVFSGVLSVQQMVAAAGDSVSSRVVKFSLSGFVPVVGGVLSEAYSTVVGCAGLLRSTVGCFGLAAVVLTVLPPLCSCVLWNVCLGLGGNAAAMFGLSALEKLCRCIAGAVRVLIAVLAVYGLLMIVSTSVVVFVGRG